MTFTLNGMSFLDKFFYEKLGWTWVLSYAALIAVIAAALALILIITFIVIAVRHAKNKKKIAALSKKVAEYENSNGANTQDTEQLREQIRKELEPSIRAELEQEYSAMSAGNSQANEQIALLNQTVAEKDKRIAELNAALSQASTTETTDNNGLYKTISELQSDVNILKAENARLKDLSEAAAKSESNARTVEKPARKTSAAKAAETYEDDDDDEYYDDYGDATSAVKVTLKYDRIKMNWVILRSDTDRTYRRVATKQEGLPIAKDLARRLHAQLVIHKKDGKFQKL